MPYRIRLLSIILLFFNGLGAIAGGYSFIADPQGGRMQMTPAQLHVLPFKTFLIPGLTLFLLVGIASLTAAILVIRKHRHSGLLIAFQGLVLIGFLSVELLVIRQLHWLQLVFGASALLLVVAGYRLQRNSRASGTGGILYHSAGPFSCTGQKIASND